MDAAGVVRSAPPGTGLDPGQRVAMLLDYGCRQEVVSAPAARVLPLPDGMSFEAGAAAPLNYLTALFALARRAHAQPGDALLVHPLAENCIVTGVTSASLASLGRRPYRRRGCCRARLPCHRPQPGRPSLHCAITGLPGRQGEQSLEAGHGARQQRRGSTTLFGF
jgi:hypothetical protein